MAKLQQLDRNSVVPLHYQIQQRLLALIQAGEFEAGQPLPPIQEIAARLSVSHMTARQAIKALCDLGVIYSKQGVGTFISGIKLEKNFRQVLSFSEEMESRGSRPSSRVLSFKVRRPTASVIETLRLQPNEEVVELKRVRSANSLPMGIECSTIPLRLCPDLPTTFDPRGSLYRELADHYGMNMAVADEIVEIGLAGSKEAGLLKISKGSPVFLFTRTSYIQNGQPVEFVRATYRGDKYKIVSRLTRIDRSLLTLTANRQ